MSVLTLNGVAVSVLATDGGHPAPTIIGSKTRSYNGSLVGDIRATKENLKGKTPPLSQTEAMALRGLLQGYGHSWSFDADLYSDLKGLLATTSGTATVVSSGKYGSRVKLLGDDLIFPVGLPVSGSTVLRGSAMWWRFDTDLATPAWHHELALFDSTASAATGFYRDGSSTTDTRAGYVFTSQFRLRTEESRHSQVSGGTQFGTYGAGFAVVVNDSVTATVGGVVYLFVVTAGSGTTGGGGSPSATWHSTFTDNGATFQNQGQAAGLYDDVVLLPYDVPSSWVSQLYTEMAARAWTSNPRLRVAGDNVQGAPLTMLGELGDAQTIVAALSGASVTSNNEQVEFSLAEV